mgnify:CR=1 FL=1
MKKLIFRRFKTLLNFIKSRLQTEKANNFIKKNKHTFLVDKHIKKNQIKLVFEEIYNTSICSINTCILQRRIKKRKNIFGVKPQYKKVYVKFNSLVY